MYKTLGIDKLASAPMHPQGQGLVERFNSTLATMMEMYVNSLQTDWDLYLPRLLWAYRSAYHETLGDSPFFCLYGRDPVQPLDIVFANLDPSWKSDDLPQWRRHQSALFRTTRHLVEEQLIEGQNKSARYKASQVKTDFEPSDSVWVYQHFRKSSDPDDHRIKKLAYSWHGPYRIYKKQGDNTYRIYLPSHPDRIVPINVDRLKKSQGYWSRPYDDEIPPRLILEGSNPIEDTNPNLDDVVLPDLDPMDAQLDSDMLPPSSFKDRITYSDGDLAYTNSSSPISEIIGKRRKPGKEIEYLVKHADDNLYWTPRSRLGSYESFVEEYENQVRSEQGLPPLRRSGRLRSMDVEPHESIEF
ncbi:hypothetical protein LEN26_017527 [Aphanomyces euteiches]|nr:hypothetical protein LEN26_017527 [Aphanomyces euteiches]